MQVPITTGMCAPETTLYTSSLVALDAGHAAPSNGTIRQTRTTSLTGMQCRSRSWPILPGTVKRAKSILWADRNGFFYVLDRATGQFLLGKPFVKQNWNAGFDEHGRPIMTPNAKSSTEGTLIFPDNQGGTNWFNPSLAPRPDSSI